MRQKYGFCCHLTTFYTENKGLKSNIFKKWEFAIFFYLQMSRFHYFCVILVKMETHQFEIEAKCMRPMLLNLAVRYTGSVDEAEDIVQETLLKLWFMRDRLEQYRSIEALASVMTKHLCLNNLRDKREMEHDLSNLTMVDETTVEQKWMEKEEEEEILNLVNALPDLQQAVLRMKHIEGLEVDEIARIINSNAVAVRANLSRARRKVKEQFMKLR